jgi:hypothetical protein
MGNSLFDPEDLLIPFIITDLWRCDNGREVLDEYAVA